MEPERERADTAGHRAPRAAEPDEAGPEPDRDVAEEADRDGLGRADGEQRPGGGEGEKQVPPRRNVEGVDDLHPGEQSGERDLDRAQLAGVGGADDLQDEGGEDAEHRDR